MDDAYRFAPAAPGEDYVYGAASPGWHTLADHETALAEWIKFMRDQDIGRVVCLLAGPKNGGCHTNIQQYAEAFGRENVMHAPMPDGPRLVDQETLENEILPFLSESVREETPVVVHGLAGLGRTGQVIAAWLVYHHGYTPRNALEIARQMGRFPREPTVAGNVSEKALETRLAVISR